MHRGGGGANPTSLLQRREAKCVNLRHDRQEVLWWRDSLLIFQRSRSNNVQGQNRRIQYIPSTVVADLHQIWQNDLSKIWLWFSIKFQMAGVCTLSLFSGFYFFIRSQRLFKGNLRSEKLKSHKLLQERVGKFDTFQVGHLSETSLDFLGRKNYITAVTKTW